MFWQGDRFAKWQKRNGITFLHLGASVLGTILPRPGERRGACIALNNPFAIQPYIVFLAYSPKRSGLAVFTAMRDCPFLIVEWLRPSSSAIFGMDQPHPARNSILLRSSMVICFMVYAFFPFLRVAVAIGGTRLRDGDGNGIE